ncbi:MAG TPA: AraC family transcriptional regulator [Dokdonella sp.]
MKFGPGDARGILRRLGPVGRFHHARHPPLAPLGAFVQYGWIVRWDLRGEAPQLQETLPHPNVYLVFEKGVATVNGVASGRWSRMLEGEGFAFGLKFRPGGFRPFLGRAVSSLCDRSLPVQDVFGDDARRLEREVFACTDDSGMHAVAQRFLLERLPAVDPEVDRVAAIVEAIAADRSLLKVDDLVARHGIGKRTLQRLFSEYVGVGPKWVIARYRLHEAIDRIADGERVDWSTLALDLGYFDQAHFIRDFRGLVGRTPAEYAQTVRDPG